MGEVPDPPEPRQSKRIYCDACEGTGNGAIHGVDGTCSACDGDGYVPAPLPEEPSKKARDLVENLSCTNWQNLGAGELADAEDLILKYIANLESEVASLSSQLEAKKDPSQ